METQSSVIIFEIEPFPWKKLHFKISSAKMAFCLNLNLLMGLVFAEGYNS